MNGKITRPRDLDCPSCGSNNRDGKVCLFPDGNIYCHSCGVTTISKDNKNKKPKPFEFIPQQYKSIPQVVVDTYDNECCNLEGFLFDNFDNNDVIRASNEYNLGRDPKTGRTAFIFQDIYQKYRYIKCVNYNRADGKRNKEDKFPFFAPYNSKGGFKACLFGEHLLKDHKGAVELVESEKTAIIASIMYPNLTWLATGGSNGLTYEKAEHLRGRLVRKWVDCDPAGRRVDKDRKVLRYFNADLVIKDVDPSRNDKADLADIILENLNQ